MHEVGGEQDDPDGVGQHPHQRRPVGLHVHLLQRAALALDRADRGVDGGGDDLVGAVDVARERHRQRDEPGRRQAVVELDGEDLALGDDQRADDGEHDRGREAQVARGDLAVVAQGQAIRGDPQRGGDRDHVAGHLADDQAPHPQAGGRGERDGDDEADDRLDRLQRALAPVVHAPEEHPQRRLERERDRQVGEARHQRQQPVVAVDGGDHRRERQDDQAHRHRQPQLDRERVLELALLVGLLLLDERPRRCRPA